MLRGEDGGTWDIRCPGSLFKLRDSLKANTNYKVDAAIAKQIIELLARAYHVKRCQVKAGSARKNKLFKGLDCVYTAPVRAGDRPTLFVRRAHVRSVFHEFYHHLEYITDGRYNSSDRLGHAQEYAQRMWNVLTAEYHPITLKVKVHTDGRGIYIEYMDKRLRPLGKGKLHHPGTYVYADFRRVPASTDYTAAVRPAYLGPDHAASDTWSSVQSQLTASKPPPPAKRVKAEKLTAAQRKRRLRAARLLAAGLPPDPADLRIKCSEDFCTKAAKFKYLDELWRCGEHHRKRVKFVKSHFKTDVEVKREQIAALDKLIAAFKQFGSDVESGRLTKGQGWLRLGKLVKMGERLGCDMSDVTRRAELTLQKVERMEAAMTTKTTKSNAKAAKPTTKSAKKPDAKHAVKGKTAKPAAKTATKANGDWRTITLKPTAKITILVKECPYSGKRAKRWTYKNGMTVEKAVEAGARPADVKYDIGHGRISAK